VCSSDLNLLSKVSSKMGRDAFHFSYWSPNGHYELNLANQIERDVAVTLFIMNKEVFKRIAAGEKADRSQMGNKSCFRNEKYNSKLFIMNNEWQVPHNGTLEFDFMMIIDVPDPSTVVPDDQLVKLLEWFQFKAEGEKADPYALSMAFASITEHLALRSEQLAQFVTLIEGKMSLNKLTVKLNRSSLADRGIHIWSCTLMRSTQLRFHKA